MTTKNYESNSSGMPKTAGGATFCTSTETAFFLLGDQTRRKLSQTNDSRRVLGAATASFLVTASLGALALAATDAWVTISGQDPTRSGSAQIDQQKRASSGVAIGEVPPLDSELTEIVFGPPSAREGSPPKPSTAGRAVNRRPPISLSALIVAVPGNLKTTGKIEIMDGPPLPALRVTESPLQFLGDLPPLATGVGAALSEEEPQGLPWWRFGKARKNKAVGGGS
jgi:hypothetical protein